MNYSEKMLTIAKNSESKFKEKGSSFFGFAFNISSNENVNYELKNLKKNYYDATHHCYAYKINSGEEKYSDDGEPNGTAGLRIFNAINHFNLTNILVVVVRYFGGVKLGVGPLGKAYSTCAFDVLKTSKIIEFTKFQKIEIIYNYEDSSKVHHLTRKFECEKIIEKFDRTPKINCFIEPYKIELFKNEVENLTKGKVSLTAQNEEIYLELTKIKI
ncbi:MAG: YigZ family protein [Ignavibacteriae bacterium]|nr:YigZ family protein [Ignavibacteriota bacterium]